MHLGLVQLYWSVREAFGSGNLDDFLNWTRTPVEAAVISAAWFGAERDNLG